MRAIILTVSALSLSACSMSGSGNPWQSAWETSNAPSGQCQGAWCKSHYRQTTYSQRGGSYHVYDPYSHAPQTPSAHAYGTQAAHSHAGYTHHGLRKGPSYKRANFYGSLGGAMYDIEQDFIGVQGRLGVDSGRIFGAEFEASTGIAGDDSTGSDRDIESSFGLFATARVPVSRNIRVLGRAGYHLTKINREGIVGPDFESGEAYGAGLEIGISSRDSLRADYTRYDAGNSDGFDAVSVAFQRRF